MSADLLRRAASEMRRRAEAATPGPWEHGHEGLQGGEVIRAGDVRVARVYKSGWPNYVPDCENAEHIASWHPAVALAVADWLDFEAGHPDTIDGYLSPEALAAARVYLGSES